MTIVENRMGKTVSWRVGSAFQNVNFESYIEPHSVSAQLHKPFCCCCCCCCCCCYCGCYCGCCCLLLIMLSTRPMAITTNNSSVSSIELIIFLFLQAHDLRRNDANLDYRNKQMICPCGWAQRTRVASALISSSIENYAIL